MKPAFCRAIERGGGMKGSGLHVQIQLEVGEGRTMRCKGRSSGYIREVGGQTKWL